MTSATAAQTDATTLPARQLRQDEDLVKQDTYEVGDVVGIFSRGAPRLARVAKLGRTNVTVEYCTQGALRDATKVYEMDLNASVDNKALTDITTKNYRFYEQELNPATRRFKEYFTAKEEARYRELTAASLEVVVGRAVYEAQDKALARRLKAKGEGLQGYLARANITTKSVKLADVFGKLA